MEFQLSSVRNLYSDNEIWNLGAKVIAKIPQWFVGLHFKPSLLHGDLWSGNWSADDAGNPVLFDPATYYGHSEAELSIMNMFGGFSSTFWKEYHKSIPKAPMFEERMQLYELYHYLNHYNIFGVGYRGSCIRIMRSLT